MRSQTSSLDYTAIGPGRIYSRVRIADAAAVKMPLFTRNIYIGSAFAWKNTALWLADHRAGDFTELELKIDFEPNDFGSAQNNELLLQYESTEAASVLAEWFRSRLDKKRLALELTDDCGSVECYAQFLASFKLANSGKQGINLVQLSFRRTHPYTQSTNIDFNSFLSPVYQ